MIDPLGRLRSLDLSGFPTIAGPICAALQEVLGGRAAERALDRVLRDHRDWAPDQRRAAAEVVFGVSLWRRRLGEPGAPAEALVAAFLRDLAGWASEKAAAAVGLGIAALPRPHEPRTLGERWSFPEWIVEIFQRELGDELEPFLAALNVPGPICLRANLLVGSREQLAERLAAEGVPVRPATHSPTGLIAEARFNVLGSEAYRAGAFEVQDEGSQLLGHLLGARPGETVLDLCAGAGGKTLLLAAEMRGEGELFAFDPDLEKLDRLVQRAARARARVSVLRRLPESLRADRILVDAPCSELGALRRGPDLRHRIDPASLARFPPLQREILETATRHLEPGGSIVYATCTLRREENEEVVQALLERHPELSLAPLTEWLDPSFRFGPYFRALPHRHRTDGFFAAVIRSRN